ncbi:MAG: 4Fe-4S dicluster domain-containing protein [Desulfobacterales bacterium]|nr:4Fe-4S dicluster domain-containing protein [Desulfobacterales bacterium]MDJ0885785.1 4Fe-4S dicluster domain-containing protein [Desulfobacterales bacterium]MDJ0990660.1 4Fe-4S dicluster domain-containing protein [Desulfobacterales bacterium]
MKKIRNRKGYDLNISGAPSDELVTLSVPATVAALPERIPFIKPRLRVKTGDPVQVGSILYEDKTDPRIVFASPGGGVVADIVFGPRRVIREIVIALDREETAVTFPALTETDLDGISRDDLVARLLEGGVWPLLRELPFRKIASPDSRPPAIMVPLDAREPFRPSPERYLTQETHPLFAFGLKVLKRLSDKVIVFTDPQRQDICRTFKNELTHTIEGRYPADDPGVLLYHLRRGPEDNRAWFIDGQDLLLLAGFLRRGTLPTERLFVVGGSGAAERQHVLSRLGAPLKHLVLAAPSCPEPRYVVGGVLRGYRGNPEGHAGLYETAVNVLPEATERDFLNLFRPGFNKPTRSRTFVSAIKNVPMAMDTNVNGGRRACIACGYCSDVCPVDILPQMTLKSILAEEVEEYLAHGLLDCVECGLCSYVCPSKIELVEIFRQTKFEYHKEQVS